MKIIPVLDIKAGLVVRGIRGERADYRPIQTPLAESADPVAVAGGLKKLGAFDVFYLADLDAIEGRGPNEAVVDALVAAFPQTQFWIDAGFRTGAEIERLSRTLGNEANGAREASRVAVAGSESLRGACELDAVALSDAVLSLDFKGDEFLGDPAILDRPASWPRRLVAMTLAKVGSGEGPDLRRLGEIAALAGDRAVFAAGGVRDAGDLEALRAAGIAGALIASALHDGRLTARDIARLAA